MEKLKSLSELKKLTEFPANYIPRYKKPVNELTDEQLITYRKLKYGLRAFSETELIKMSPRDKRAITYKQERANAIISEMQQDKLNTTVIKTMNRVFPDLNGNMKAFLLEPLYDKHFMIDNTIPAVKLSQEEIYIEFKKRGLI